MTLPSPAFLALSARIGANPSWVQGAGGNTSEKHGDTIWVKASGALLSEAEASDMFVPLHLSALRAQIAQGLENAGAVRAAGGPDLRPSIESTLHAASDHRVVVHTHAVRVIAVAARRDAKAVLERALAGLDWVFVPYARPGLPLAQAMLAAADGRSPAVMVIANHGLVVGADDPAGAMALIEAVDARLAAVAPPPAAADTEALIAATAGTDWGLPLFPETHALAFAPALDAVCAGVLYPDHVVFLGPGPVPVLSVADITAFTAAARAPYPVLAVARDVGVIVRADATRGAHEMARALALVADHVAPGADLVYLDAAQERELLSWDAETYRQALERARHGP